MVNKNNVGQYNASPPPDSEDGDLSINGGSFPLYPPSDVLEILGERKDAITLWTKKCIRDVQNMSMENADVAALIGTALRQERYINSQWCVPTSGGPWAACDAYRVTREEWLKQANKYMDIEYYLKFAIHRSGKRILTVSCHVSGG